MAGCGCTGGAGRAGGKKASTKGKRIRIDRDAHKRRGYFRKDGTWVRPTRVKRAYFLEKDPGKPGRLARGTKFGPYRAPEHRKWIQNAGALGGPGFTKRPKADRRKILAQSVMDTSYATTMRRLYVLTRPVALAPKTRRVLEGDIRWLRRTFKGMR